MSAEGQQGTTIGVVGGGDVTQCPPPKPNPTPLLLDESGLIWGTGELDVLSSLTRNNLVCVLKALIRLSVLVCFAALAPCGLAGHDACAGWGRGVSSVWLPAHLFSLRQEVETEVDEKP